MSNRVRFFFSTMFVLMVAANVFSLFVAKKVFFPDRGYYKEAVVVMPFELPKTPAVRFETKNWHYEGAGIFVFEPEGYASGFGSFHCGNPVERTSGVELDAPAYEGSVLIVGRYDSYYFDKIRLPQADPIRLIITSQSLRPALVIKGQRFFPTRIIKEMENLPLPRMKGKALRYHIERY